MKKVFQFYGLIALILVIGLTSADSVLGQARQDHQNRSGRGGPPPCPLITALDANNNEVIEETELANAPAVLLKLDKDGNSSLTEDELRPDENNMKQHGNDQKMRGNHQPPPSPIFSALDSNSNGQIDSDEIQNAVSVLKNLDTNSDGELSRDELRPQNNRGPRH